MNEVAIRDPLGGFTLDADPRDLERLALTEDYHRFIRKTWPVLEPGVPFVDGMPIGAVTEHLQALMEGTLGKRNLLINIPPRCMKSTSVSVALVPWVWARPEWSHLKFLYTSYSGDLSMRDSIKARRLIKSPWYQERFGSVYSMTGDQNVKGRFDNNRNGTRLATSVGGQGTGEGGDVIIADDPHNAQEAESDTVREGTVRWWRETMSTRGNNPDTVRKIVVMQRLNEADLSGYILAEEIGEYVHLCLPMRYEKKRIFIGSMFKDPRTADGQLLWPERFSEQATARLERSLGEYGAAGQLQQRPAPRGGGMVKETSFHLWSQKKALPDFTYVIQSYDTAFTERTTGDPTGCLTLGVFIYQKANHVMILDAWDEMLNYPALRKKVVADWKAVYGGTLDDDLHPGRRPDIVVVENKGSGQSILQDLRAAKVPAFAYNPGKADKMARLQGALPLIETDILWVPESKNDPNEPVKWVRDAIKQITTFPAAAHDEYVDCLSQGLLYLRDLGLLDLEEVEDEDEETTKDYGVKKGENPYDPSRRR